MTELFRVWGGDDQAFEQEVHNLRRLLTAMLGSEDVAVDLAAEDEPGRQRLADGVGVPEETATQAGSLILRTSGTTGVPKAVSRSLLPTRPIKKNVSARWLLTYQPVRWAGISVMSHVILSGGTLCVADRREVGPIVDTGIATEATHLAVTPTFLRMMVLARGRARVSSIPVQQVTLGGEFADQPVLDLARELWPGARVTHVLASTEHGDMCAASDGLAGFPDQVLLADGRTIDADGELHVRGRPTGDHWRFVDQRWLFAGRAGDAINIAGTLVSATMVEEAALALPGVLFARASATPSPITGTAIKLEYVGAADASFVRSALRRQLPKVAWPALTKELSEVPVSATGKLMR